MSAWNAERARFFTSGFLKAFIVIYEAKDQVEFMKLGGLLSRGENPRIRCLGGTVMKLEAKTGVATIKLRTGHVVTDVPFDADRGEFPNYTPGTWNMMSG